MIRIMKWRLTGLAVGFVAVAGFAALPRNERTQAPRPNILFVLTDDLDAAELAFMPHVKSLMADQGVSFANYFVNVSLCCPSRATMLRGQYARNSGVRTNGGSNGGFERMYSSAIEQSTVATWLQSVGYHTALYGKYLNGYPGAAPTNYVPPGWTEWASSVAGNAYSEYNYTLNENGRSVRYGASPSDYGTDVYARKAAAFMRRAATAKAPFFIYLSVYAPHGPATPAPRHATLFPGVRAPRTPSFDEADVSDKPAFIRNRPKLRPRPLATIDSLYRKRLQSLQAVDEAVASLVDTLKANGQLDNTFIVFTSDNGFHLGQHRLVMGKQTAYEEDIHVPLIVRGPGVPAGRVVQHFSGNVDLAPTFAELGGATAPAFVDGRSLAPLLRRTLPSLASWRQVFLVEHWTQSQAQPDDSTREPPDDDQVTVPPPGGRGGRGGGRGAGRGGAQPAGANAIPEFHALRTQRYSYVEYVTGEVELYDLSNDPHQLNNKSAEADRSLLAALSGQLAQLKSCAASTCRDIESRRP